MRALVQRVTSASVTVDGDVVGSIGHGFVVLVGVTHSDSEAVASKLAAKVANLRLFESADAAEPRTAERGSHAQGEQSLLDVRGGALVVSQFTLYGDTSRGRRPSWDAAAPGEQAEPLVEAFADALRGLGIATATGRFGADMQVALVNDGPVTLMLEVA